MAPRHVLVADDEELIRSALRELLEEEGFVVSEARTGLEVQAALASPGRPDLVLMDVRMPGKDGLSVLREAEPVAGVGLPMIVSVTSRSVRSLAVATRR